MLLCKCMMAESERENIIERTTMSSNQRAREGKGQSRYFPYGYRFKIKLKNTTVIESFRSGGHERDVNEKLTLVPHLYETKQMNALLPYPNTEKPKHLIKILQQLDLIIWMKIIESQGQK